MDGEKSFYWPKKWSPHGLFFFSLSMETCPYFSQNIKGCQGEFSYRYFTWFFFSYVAWWKLGREYINEIYVSIYLPSYRCKVFFLQFQLFRNVRDFSLPTLRCGLKGERWRHCIVDTFGVKISHLSLIVGVFSFNTC